MAINVTVRKVAPVPPPDRIVVEMDREDAQALATAAYTIGGGQSLFLGGSNEESNIRLRDRLRVIGNAIYAAVPGLKR